MPELLSSIACNLDAGIVSASFPLLEEGRVEAIEWSFDALHDVSEVPAWFDGLLREYSNAGRLIGHGIFFSLFSGRWTQGQKEWLAHLKYISSVYRFDHITEHFGFMTGGDFHSGAPLNIPYNSTTLAIGRSRLAHIYDACKCPVGLENLAFACTADEARRHGDFLDKLLEPVNGFLILDLHNLYCQMYNFSLSFEELMNIYPLHRVREIHISGGSWEAGVTAPQGRVRRDTHDDAVPEEVFRLLGLAIPRCPNLKYVVMEQLGMGLQTQQSRTGFYNDFIRMQQIVKAMQDDRLPVNDFMPIKTPSTGTPLQNEALHIQQMTLSNILETATSIQDATDRLRQSPLAATDWHIEDWQPYMLETARQIARKWKR